MLFPGFHQLFIISVCVVLYCGLVLIPVHSVMCKKVMLLLDQYAVFRISSAQCAVYNKCMCGLVHVLWTSFNTCMCTVLCTKRLCFH